MPNIMMTIILLSHFKKCTWPMCLVPFASAGIKFVVALYQNMFPFYIPEV